MLSSVRQSKLQIMLRVLEEEFASSSIQASKGQTQTQNITSVYCSLMLLSFFNVL